MMRDATAMDVSYVASHMREADAREVFGMLPASCTDLLVSETLRQTGPRWAALCDTGLRVPAAVGGVTEVRRGVWSAWCYTTNRFPEVAREVTAHARKAFATLELGGHCHRMEAISWEGHTQAHRWLGHHLGFELEGRLAAYGRDQEDYLMYVRIHRGAQHTEKQQEVHHVFQ